MHGVVFELFLPVIALQCNPGIPFLVPEQQELLGIVWQSVFLFGLQFKQWKHFWLVNMLSS